MAEGYPVPAGLHRKEATVRRSRFIATVGHAPDAGAAHALVGRVRDEFPDATHTCWAFVAGPPGDTARVGMSDDGEPHGTAGRPMLTVLLHSGVGEVVAVVTRYYGGVKLGKGGLGRAYAGAVVDALERMPFRVQVEQVLREISADYPHVEGIFRLLDELAGERVAEDWGGRVRIRVSVPEGALTRLEAGVAEITGGRGRVQPITDDPA